MRVDMMFFRKDNHELQVRDVENMLHQVEGITRTDDYIVFEEYRVKYNTKLSSKKMYAILSLFDDRDNRKGAYFLSELKDLILKGEHRSSYRIIISYDESTMYFNGKLFPIITKYETYLRQLIYLILIDTFGNDWVIETLPEDKQAEIKKRIPESQSSIEYALDAFDFHSYYTFLFEKRPNRFTDDFIDMTIAKIDALKKDNISKDEVIDFFVKNKSYSLWELLFSDLNYTNVENDILSIRDIRNNVMHGKKISNDEFEEYKRILLRANRQIKEYIAYVENQQISEVKHLDVLEVLQVALKGIDDQRSHLIEPLQKAIDIYYQNYLTSFANQVNYIKNYMQSLIPKNIPDTSRLIEDVKYKLDLEPFKEIEEKYRSLIRRFSISTINAADEYLSVLNSDSLNKLREIKNAFNEIYQTSDAVRRLNEISNTARRLNEVSETARNPNEIWRDAKLNEIRKAQSHPLECEC